MNEENNTSAFAENHSFHVPKSTWTHMALHCKDIDKMFTWYEDFTHFSLLYKEQDENGYGAWLGDSSQKEHPFVLVLMQFHEGKDPFSPAMHHPLGPFAHIGIEMPEKRFVDEVATKADKAGCLTMGPIKMPRRIGYICFVRDPEGNVVEFSFDQGVYTKAREVWGGTVK